MILEIDLGNTRAKWRLMDGRQAVARGVFVQGNSLEKMLPCENIDRIKVVSVASHSILQALRAQLSLLGVELEMALSAKTTAGVSNGYAQPERLGVDRWSAVVAAYQQRRSAVLVVDAGSALTVDAVDASGVHLGGYITPGLGLMRNSLLQNTGGVRFERNSYDLGVSFACNTDDAVSAGLLASSVGAVLVALAEAEKILVSGFDVVMTGGDAGLIEPFLPEMTSGSITVVPELVLDGLQWLLP